nr:restriction endonuclease subunit S [Neomicrococcus lactis]
MTVFPRIPIKYVTTYNDEVLPEAFDPDSMINYIEISDVDSSVGISGSITVSFAEAPSRARRIVRKGDVLVSTVRTYLRAIASVDREYDGSIASTGFCVLRPADVHPGFLKYATSSPDFIEEVIARSAGISYPAINATDLVRLSIPAPSQKEQTRISSFLDRETAQIDELIGKQERLIELLAEKRRAIITHAVTKGLDPAAPTKPSGVPWLGDVNATWPLRPLKAAGHISLGKMIQPNPKQDDDFEAPYLRAANVQPHGTLALDDVKTMWFNSSELRSLDVRTGDVVVVEGGVGGGRPGSVRQPRSLWVRLSEFNHPNPPVQVSGRAIPDLSPANCSALWLYTRLLHRCVDAPPNSGEVSSHHRSSTEPHHPNPNF